MYYIVNADTDQIIERLYERPTKEWLDQRAKEEAESETAGCSLYVIEGERQGRLEGNYYPLVAG